MRYLLILLISFLFSTTVSGQYSSRVNAFMQTGYSLPMPRDAHMDNYYTGGYNMELHIVSSFSKRSSDARLSLLINSGLNWFGGKTWWGYDSQGYFTEYRSQSIFVVPVHAGLRLDFGNTRSYGSGLYVSQDFGLTYIDGPTGGSRYGHTFNIGSILNRFDVGFGFNTWKGSTGNKFHFIAFRMGYMIF